MGQELRYFIALKYPHPSITNNNNNICNNDDDTNTNPHMERGHRLLGTNTRRKSSKQSRYVTS